ncbi:MAG: hypothetical protein RLY35_2098 [Bacteroidota bacterium]|jgi:membrane-bound lytic murein transglycosylase F
MKPWRCIGIALIFLLLSACREKSKPVFVRDWDQIVAKDSLIVLIENSASTYFNYRDEQRGFDYELIKTFCEAHHITPVFKVMDNVDSMFHDLNAGKADIIASNITQTAERDSIVSFCTPLYTTKQVLVQRWASRDLKEKYACVQDTASLDSLSISVHAYSTFHSRLKAMEQASGKSWSILTAPGKYSTDDLVRLVAEGKIEATVTDASLAGILSEDYPNIQFDLSITVPEPIAWVVRKNAIVLKDKINEWLAKERVQWLIKDLRKEYFKSNTTHVALFHSDVTMPKIKGNQISTFDGYFKEAAKSIDWDWRLLAALCYQESNFDPSVVSRHGAFGLMQLMPETAMKYGCDSTDSVAGNIQAGALLIKQLDKALAKRVRNKEERMKFVLAAYNAGLGHVLDAIEIAQYNKTPDSLWFNHVENDLLLKAQKEYYTLPGVKSGYCRCHETYHFVHRVLSFYDHFKSKVK